MMYSSWPWRSNSGYIAGTALALTLTVLVVTTDALRHFQTGQSQHSGMGDVGAARYEPALLPPYPTIRVLSYSNCQRSIHSSSRAWQFKC